MSRLIFTTLISFSLSICIWTTKQSSTEYIEKVPNEWMVNDTKTYTPKEHIRPGDQTFLTFPEWYLVHSPKEQAMYFRSNTSSTFPYWEHVLQLWKSYMIVSDQILESYEFNYGYHLMIVVLTVSTTVEYGAKQVYEKMIGRITSNSEDQALTEEDQFNAKFTQSYVDFILQTPWYEYNFFQELKTLWIDVPLFGDHMIRKWERRYYLTTDIFVKAVYGFLIKKATKATYEDPILGTAIVLDESIPTNDKIQLLNGNDPFHSVYLIPRYADFHPTLESILIGKTVELQEIAGNSSATLVTVLLKKNESLPKIPDSKTVFRQDIMTRPGENRYALVSKVQNLKSMLEILREQNIEIEHIYDF
ncbi:hypothetical protein EHQ75_14605 [Leptospira levettii]|uniref:Uncharacterized protein n=1 Tax=Leptospira levettii TaxID=2023178 RepID=A0AAW5V348_9LEPT|nr:hypothetical protein [Leptospira levettii]MCW7465053.1 hypothetical protein [Leptospira levettii]MCW7498491.1 hypothetical protein [Leptospira levettii]MCW7509793.1 hypothetical protein [Leptospira levettii]MCW7513543.1 hypothetical protein [Leptospira levettii]TGM27615.1 hypothetical protein EHQ71_16500 [Leptospira levettii]